MSIKTKNYPISFWISIENSLTESIKLLQDKVSGYLAPLEAKFDIKDSVLQKAEWRRTQIAALLTEIRMIGFLKYEVSNQLIQGKADAGIPQLILKGDVLQVLIRNQEILLENVGDREAQEAQLDNIGLRLASIKGVGDGVASEKARWRDLPVKLDILGEVDLPRGATQLQKLKMDHNNIELEIQRVIVTYELSMVIQDELSKTLEKIGVELDT